MNNVGNDVSVEKCECGSKKYGYYADNGIIFICFNCGRFHSGDMPENLINVFLDDPQILLALIKSGHLKPLGDINDG
jgi:hypothetical protein